MTLSSIVEFGGIKDSEEKEYHIGFAIKVSLH